MRRNRLTKSNRGFKAVSQLIVFTMATKLKRTYIESEAEHSGDESRGSDGSEDEYEKGSFVVDSDEESGDDAAAAKARAKRAKTEADKERDDAEKQVADVKARAKKGRKAKDAEAAGAAPAVEKHKPHGNKGLPAKHVPPAPAAVPKKDAKTKDFHYAITFTNARYAQSFWDGPTSALASLFLHIEVRDTYAGLRLEAYDNPPTMAIKSRMECIIEEGVDEDGTPVDRASLNGQSFCLSSQSLMRCFKCAQIKDAPLRLIKKHGRAGIYFTAVTNESDVRSSYFCPMIERSPSLILQKINTSMEKPIRLRTEVLKSLASKGTTLDASVIRIKLYTLRNPDESIKRDKVVFWFPGEDVRGGTTFYLNAKKTARGDTTEYEAIEQGDFGDEEDDEDDDTVDVDKDGKPKRWKLVSKTAYQHKKYKLFVSNLDIDWCVINVSTDGRPKPLIMLGESEEGAANRTSVMIIISPTTEDDE